jgi:hypothetical protein
MKKGISFTMIILFWAFYLNAQDTGVLVSGNYQHTPLKSFINEIEQKYPVRFYFDEKTIDNINVTAVFQDTPLKQCLEIILKTEPVNFEIFDDQVVIYSGSVLSDIFPGLEQGAEIGHRAEGSLPSALSTMPLTREKLLQQQYRITNIGTPGKNNAETATLSGYL